MRRTLKLGLINHFASIIILLTIAGCAEKSPVTGPTAQNTDSGSLAKHGINTKFNQVNLVSDIMFQGARIDPNLGHAWGMAVTPSGLFWISANHTGLSVIYDSAGNQKINPVTIPTAGNVLGGGTIRCCI
jgi:hypothetical protein